MAKKQRLPNVHPGEVLLEEFVEPLRITQYRLANELRVPATRIAELCGGKRSITADTALRLAKFFGTTPKFWMGLQEDYDLEEQGAAIRGELIEIRRYRKAS